LRRRREARTVEVRGLEEPMADESYPSELKYYREHDWVRVADGEAVFGISWFAQDALGEIVYVSLPETGEAVDEGGKYGELESVKAVSDIYAPLAGEIVGVNDRLNDEPGLINDDPYGGGWIVRVRLTDPSQLEGLMDADAYRQFLTEA
jgi:glycine cleavage system H protein